MCNLKSNKNLKEILEYKKELQDLSIQENVFVLFPSSLYLSFFYNVSYPIGSQNLSVYQTGSFTGEIMAEQLKSLHVSYVLMNHAEASESIKDVRIKIKNAFKENLKVVLCIGEKEKKSVEEVLEEIKKDLELIFSSLTMEEMQNIILAYEPFWTIHTKTIKNPEVISCIVKKLKKELKKTYHLTLPILYGGGITLKNIDSLIEMDELDGYLLGNCALNPQNIKEILEKI